jgi:hypothetical protein
MDDDKPSPLATPKPKQWQTESNSRDDQRRKREEKGERKGSEPNPPEKKSGTHGGSQNNYRVCILHTPPVIGYGATG